MDEATEIGGGLDALQRPNGIVGPFAEGPVPKVGWNG